MLELKTLIALQEHAKQESPRECCGVVIDVNGVQSYMPCNNIAEGEIFFIIDPEDYRKASLMGEIIYIAHSHPKASTAKPSKADIASCNRGDVEWVIINGDCTDTQYIKPELVTSSYVGREYIHGVFDCATLLSDYYKDSFGVTLDYPIYTKQDWWEEGGSRFIEQLQKNGFRQIEESEMKSGDVIAMQIRAKVPNHGAIYLDGNIILHHCFNRPSGKDVYGGFWRKHTSSFWRHNAND